MILSLRMAEGRERLFINIGVGKRGRNRMMKRGLFPEECLVPRDGLRQPVIEGGLCVPVQQGVRLGAIKILLLYLIGRLVEDGRLRRRMGECKYMVRHVGELERLLRAEVERLSLECFAV